MYTADVHNIVFEKLNKILQYPICSVVHVFGVQKGENTLWSCNILHQIEWHLPHFIHFIVIIAINIETPYLPVRCTSIPVMYGIIGMWFFNLWKSFAIYLATSLVT